MFTWNVHPDVTGPPKHSAATPKFHTDTFNRPCNLELRLKRDNYRALQQMTGIMYHY